MSNQVMIWFFFIYYKQLKFYGTEQISANSNKTFQNRTNCHILKFSNGGQYLIAGNKENNVFLIDSYTREILENFFISIRGYIKDIVFSDDDVYIYVCCTNGHIFEINLNTGVNKLLVKQDNINFIYSYFYLDEQLIGGQNIKIYNLLLCGKDIISEKYSLTELSYTIELKKNDIDVNFSNLTYLTDKVNCVLFIQSEKLYNSLIVLGTLDGKIILTESPISKVDHKLKELYLHKGPITKLLYSKETHLLFSCGDDGNIFILVIQEIGGDEAFYESLITNINLITHIGDSGLGENVLIPAWDMNRIEKTKGKKNILEKEFEE